MDDLRIIVLLSHNEQTNINIPLTLFTMTHYRKNWRTGWVSGIVFDWFASYLKNRDQFVKIGNFSNAGYLKVSS